MRWLILISKNSSIFSEFFLRVNINHWFSMIVEFESCFFRAETSFAVDDDVVVNMSNTQQMTRTWKNHLHRKHKIFLHIDHDNRWIWNIQSHIQSSQLSQNSAIILDDLLRSETKRDVKACMQDSLIVDDEKRHTISICLVRAVHYQYFVIDFQHFLRCFFDEKEMNYLIQLVLLHFVKSIILI
jgi:hypothetical protein